MYEIGQPEIDAVTRVISSGKLFRYTDRANSEATRFEDMWSHAIGTDHAIAVNSGTSALVSALVGVGVEPGDEVIIPGYTFVATAVAVIAVGAIPIIANIDAGLTIDPDDLEQRITSKTRAIIPVHMRGMPCRMDRVMEIASRHGLMVVEDVCQAAGGAFRSTKLGSIGHAGAFSFNYFKTLTCGEGGAITTSCRRTYERALIHHDSGCAAFGSNATQLSMPVFAGQNYRLSEISAAILVEQTKRLDGILSRLRKLKQAIRIAIGQRARFVESHDSDGDCGTTVALGFEEPGEAETLRARLCGAGIDAIVAIATGQHVFANWRPFFATSDVLQTAYARSALNPTLQSTLHILGTTVLVTPTLQWGPSEIERLVDLL